MTATNISTHGQEDVNWLHYANFVDAITCHLAKCPPTANLVAELEARLKSTTQSTGQLDLLGSIIAELHNNATLHATLSAFFEEMFPLSLICKDFAKNNAEAAKLYREGEEQFSSGQYDKAIGSFSQALRWAEEALESYSYEDGETLFKDLIANLYDKRSAAFLKTNQPYECVLDIEELINIQSGKMSPSAYIRLAHATSSLKDFSNLSKLQTIQSQCQLFAKSTKAAQNCPPAFVERLTGYLTQIGSMVDALKEKTSQNGTTEEIDDSEMANLGAKLDSPHPTIHGVSSKMAIESSAQKGRHFVATEPIANGEVLAVEKPFSTYSMSELHCANCLRRLGSVKQTEPSVESAKTDPMDVDAAGGFSIDFFSFVPCETCCKVIFCDRKCRRQACDRFHAVECRRKMFALEEHLGIAYIALRTVLSAGGPTKALQQFQTFSSSSSPSSSPAGTFKGDYSTLLSLLTHSAELDACTLVSYLLTAIFLLHCLRQFEVLDLEPSQEQPILLLLLHHLQQMSTNLVTIFEQDIVGSGGSPLSTNVAMSLPMKEEPIGVGFYPIISLLNHSCDPDVVPLYLGSKLVLKAARDIEPHKEICFCYGPTYMKMVRSKRQKMLADNYFFTCHCTACEQGKENYYEAYLCATCNGPAFLESDSRLVCSRSGHVNAQVESVLDAVKQSREQLAAGENFLEQYKARQDSADVIAALVTIHKADVACSEHLFALNALLTKVKREMINCYLQMGHFDRAEAYSRQLVKVFQKYLNDELRMPLLQEQLRLLKILFLRVDELIEEGYDKENEESDSDEGPDGSIGQLCPVIEAALIDFERGLAFFEEKHGTEEYGRMFAKEIEFANEKWQVVRQLQNY